MYIDPVLEATSVFDLEGNAVPFSTLYAKGPTMVVFVRHFGCIFCRERIQDLSGCIKQLNENGYDAVVIGNGTPLMAQAFAEELKVTVPMYTDPERTTYELAGMKRALGLTPGSLRDVLRSLRAGARQGAVAGDLWQQGGVMTVASDGAILDRQIDRGAGDYINLLALADRIVGRAA